MKRYGLIGYPLTHSFSAKYFSEKFHREKLNDCVYDLFPIRTIEGLNDIILQHPDLLGLNVTIPYKQLVLRHLHSFEKTIPAGIRACNCIKIDGGKMTGYNTDIIGFEMSFTPLLQPHHQKALILGNGGATEAVRYVLKKNGLSCQIVSRKLHDGSTFTYTDLSQSVLKEYTVIINTTPVGMYPDVGHCPPIPYKYITTGHYLFDLVYNPLKTLFLEKGEQQGAAIKNGYDMLEIQAEESWKIWNS